MKMKRAALALAATLSTLPLAADPASEPLLPEAPLTGCYEWSAARMPRFEDDPLAKRVLEYTRLAGRHRVRGLASYYSSFFDGRKTANGEIFRNRKHSAAHLTLPLGTWIEVTSRATGRKLRMRVNDRGPYAKKFFLDLSQAAARHLGVDKAKDRYVDIRIIALPGEDPLPDHVDIAAIEQQLAHAGSAQ
jgi:rare lipoprotein A